MYTYIFSFYLGYHAITTAEKIFGFDIVACNTVVLYFNKSYSNDQQNLMLK